MSLAKWDRMAKGVGAENHRGTRTGVLPTPVVLGQLLGCPAPDIGVPAVSSTRRGHVDKGSSMGSADSQRQGAAVVNSDLRLAIGIDACDRTKKLRKKWWQLVRCSSESRNETYSDSRVDDGQLAKSV